MMIGLQTSAAMPSVQGATMTAEAPTAVFAIADAPATAAPAILPLLAPVWWACGLGEDEAAIPDVEVLEAEAEAESVPQLAETAVVPMPETGGALVLSPAPPAPEAETAAASTVQTPDEAPVAAPVTAAPEACPAAVEPTVTAPVAAEPEPKAPQSAPVVAAPEPQMDRPTPERSTDTDTARRTAAPVVAMPDPPAAQVETDDLGGIRVVFENEGETTRITLVAERPETVDLMRRHAEQFQDELQQEGFARATLDFASEDREQAPHRHHGHGEAPPSHTLPSAQPRGGLDLRI